MSHELQRVHLIVFPGVQNLPNHAAEENGFFEKRGLAIETTFTKNSQQQRTGLACGEYDIAHSAVDNAIAMSDGSGEDVAIVVGLDHGFNKLVVQPSIASYGDLHGKILGVDALDTAFALVVYEMLQRRGLNRIDYKVVSVGATRFRLEALLTKKIDFAILNLPFNLFAQAAGLKVLDSPTDAIGAYQSTGGFVKRAWAKRHRGLLVQYLAAYIEGLRWSINLANRTAVIELLQRRMELGAEVAEECYRQISDRDTGFAEDARLDLAGMANLLALRAKFTAQAGATLPAERYIEESYYRDALRVLQAVPGATSTNTTRP